LIVRKSEREIERIGAAGRIAADTIVHVGRAIEPGITTGELDRIGEDFIRSLGGIPTSKGYPPNGRNPFPGALCISPNDMIVHGIPGVYQVAEGDLLTIDVGVTLDGYVADTAYTFAVGEVAPDAERLLEVGQAALAAGIEQAQVDNRIGDISSAIQRVVEDAGFAVVRALVGHGVGRAYHEDPQIPNYGTPGRGARLSPGMTLAIEPMITTGGIDIVVDADEWSVFTADGSLSAHFEHTMAITEAGPRILTPVGAGSPRIPGGSLAT
jgi:methionyl aminopeptidase